MAKKKSIKKRAAKGTSGFPKPRFHSPNMIQTLARGQIRRTGVTIGGGGGAGIAQSGGASQAVAQSPLFYDYRWSTPDKFYFPRNRVVANAIWREIYKRDPAIATATDMYAELPWSKFDLTGIEDGTIRKLYEDMFNTLNLVPKLQAFTRDYLITGELILHNIYNSSKAIWQRVISHNPDYIRVEGVGLAIEQPLLWLRPTPEIKKLINATDPRIKKLRKALPKDLINAFRANREIPLDSLNTTYIPRLNVSTDIRGMSIYTRLFRIIMYEDFIVNASLAVAQRNAAPLRIFKLGDPNSGWLPDEDDEAAFAEMLSMAEADPLAAIIMHHNITAELVGVSDRVLLISREWDFIERVKLLAMGVSKSFLVGETSFAAAVAGLQTLLERLATLRTYFESEWMVKKICAPIAQIHEFYKRPKSEIDHRLRIKRHDEMELLTPKIKWHKVLEAGEDPGRLTIWRDLKERGLVSDRTYTTGAGVDLDTERKNITEEKKYKEEHPEIYGIPGQPPPGAPGGRPAPGGKGLPVPPPPPPMPGASASMRKYGSDNPYMQNKDAGEYLDDIEARLDPYIDQENKVDYRDVLEVLRETGEDASRFGKIEEHLPIASSNLLTGEGI